jgi:hypothetical protein
MVKTKVILILYWAAILSVGYFFFAHPNIVTRIVCFIVSLFMALNSYFYFEHAVVFRHKWQTATSGKRRTPPGQAVIAGSILLALTVAGMYWCFH